MGQKVVETIYGARSKFEIVRVPGTLITADSFSIYKDGKYWKGGYKRLDVAVSAARKG